MCWFCVWGGEGCSDWHHNSYFWPSLWAEYCRKSYVTIDQHWWIQVSSNLQPYDILKINLLNYSRLLTMPFLDSKIINGFVTDRVHTCSNIPLPPRPDPSDFTSSPIAFPPPQGKPSASFSHLSKFLLTTCHVPSPCHRYFSPGTFCLIIYLRSNFKFVHMVIWFLRVSN